MAGPVVRNSAAPEAIGEVAGAFDAEVDEGAVVVVQVPDERDAGQAGRVGMLGVEADVVVVDRQVLGLD